VSEDNVAGSFQNVVNGYPILSGGLHTHILTVVLPQPSGTPPKVPGKSGKPFPLVAGDSLLVRGGDTGYQKRFVNIHPTADWIYDF